MKFFCPIRSETKFQCRRKFGFCLTYWSLRSLYSAAFCKFSSIFDLTFWYSLKFRSWSKCLFSQNFIHWSKFRISINFWLWQNSNSDEFLTKISISWFWRKFWSWLKSRFCQKFVFHQNFDFVQNFDLDKNLAQNVNLD